MDPNPTLEGFGLSLRPLTEDDFEPLSEAASDPLIWEQHPSKERGTREGFFPYIRQMHDGGGMLVLRRGADLLGMSRFYSCPEAPEHWAIGFTFLVRSEWGGKTNGEMKTLMLTHAFETEPVIYFHIAPGNLRSQRGTAKLGARHLDDRGPDNAEQRWELKREDWLT